MTEKIETKLDMKKIVPVLVVVLVDVMGLTIIVPILPYYSIVFGASPFVIGLIGTCYPAMQFLFVPILGALSDRVGRKPVLVTAQVGTVISLLILGFSNALWMIFAARLLDGITGANLATAQSVITDSTTSENRATGLGLIGAVYGIGFVLGPILSGIALLLTDSNYAAPAFLAAGFALLSVILTTFMLDETHPPEERGGETKERGVNFGRLFQYFIDPSLGPVFWLVLGQSIIFGAFYLTFAPFTLNVLGLDILGNTIFFAVFGIISATMQGGFTGRLSSRYGERTLVLSGLMLYSIGFLLVSTTPHVAVPWYSRDALTEEIQQQVNSDAGEIEGQLALLPSEENKGIGGLIYILIAILPVPIGFGIANPNINSLITKRGDPSKIGEALGVGAAFLALGNVIGPLIGGALFDYIGPNSVTRVGGIAGFILLYMLSSRITKRAGDEKKLDDDFSG